MQNYFANYTYLYIVRTKGMSFTHLLEAISEVITEVIVVLRKAPEVRKNTDGGVNPRDWSINKTKAPDGATEYLTCLISTCIYLCRPLGAFSFVAPKTGVYTPVCGLSHLWCLFSEQQKCDTIEH